MKTTAIAKILEENGHKVVSVRRSASCKVLQLADGRAVVVQGCLPTLALVGDAKSFNGDVEGFLKYIAK